MSTKFCISQVYDKNLNFIFGAGASYGLFPTLALSIKDSLDPEKQVTIEDLYVSFKDDYNKRTLLFMYYYKKCIEPVLNLNLSTATSDTEKKVIENYSVFLKKVLSILSKKNKDKSCNLFTTNYDGCFTFAADEIIKNGVEDFILNDGARGFGKRVLHTKNFSTKTFQTGIFNKFNNEVRQINLHHLHGSVYWYKEDEQIAVDYSDRYKDRLIENELFSDLSDFFNVLDNPQKTIDDLPIIELGEDVKKQFWEAYEKLPIVNPTKWKFHETVFEEHYYQLLRGLSIELEKENSVLVSFGFSFADEHILNLIKRSLANPSLQVFVCCFNEKEFQNLSEEFSKYRNVVLLESDSLLDFTYFNNSIFIEEKNKSEAKTQNVADDLDLKTEEGA